MRERGGVGDRVRERGGVGGRVRERERRRKTKTWRERVHKV